jgi:hypothetical protein
MMRRAAFSTSGGPASQLRAAALLAALVAISATCALSVITKALIQATNNEPPEPCWTLQPNGTVGGLNALFLHQGEQLHVYIALDDVLDEKTGKFERGPDSDDLEPYWKGEPYYHEVYDLVGGTWAQERREFSQPPEDSIDLDHCDRWNRRNLRIEKEISRELPARIKIKAIDKLPNRVVVVYTDPSLQSPSELNYPPLEADLLVPDQGGWRIAESQEVEEGGYFCRSEALPVPLANGESATVLLVFTEVDSATRNFFYAQSYLIRRKPTPTPGK